MTDCFEVQSDTFVAIKLISLNYDSLNLNSVNSALLLTNPFPNAFFAKIST